MVCNGIKKTRSCAMYPPPSQTNTGFFYGSRFDPRVGSASFQNLAGRFGRLSKSHGSGRVGSGRVRRVHISRDGTGRVTLARPDPREATRSVDSPEINYHGAFLAESAKQSNQSDQTQLSNIQATKINRNSIMTDTNLPCPRDSKSAFLLWPVQRKQTKPSRTRPSKAKRDRHNEGQPRPRRKLF